MFEGNILLNSFVLEQNFSIIQHPGLGKLRMDSSPLQGLR